jgi:hypothetical protein
MDSRIPTQHCLEIGKQQELKRKSVICVIAQFCGVLFSIMLLAGCVTARLPTPEEKKAVKNGEMAIVLLKIECIDEDGLTFESFPNSLYNIWLALGTFETGGEPKLIHSLRFLSPESRREGWTFFVLPPGTYYMTFFACGHHLQELPPYWHSTTPRWRIDVPDNSKLIYSGTLQIFCFTELFGLGTAKRYKSTSKVNVVNEHNIATQLLKQHFSESGDVHVALMQRHRGPIILHAPIPTTAK